MAASVPSFWFSTPSEQGLIPCVDSIGDALRFAADLGSDDLVVLDLASGHFIDCNRSAHERLGYDRDHFLRLNPAALQADGDLADDLLRDQRRVMRQQPRGSFTTRHRARSGVCRDVSVSYQVLELHGRLVALVSHRDRTTLGDDGESLFTVGTVQDISEQHEIQQRL